MLVLESYSFSKLFRICATSDSVLMGWKKKIVPILKCAHQGIAAMNIGGITITRASKQRPFQTTDAYGEKLLKFANSFHCS